ncbi:hypothetical protein QBC41DRAFT_233496 [Cercophora samala]|uniref:2EXR domain-containing protein n=1 Tax=Cercophora samala TaxID=330535 RepID=A0AA39Z5W2_9PEZI|nr:hypothetical protein QBC41DRAFT_233496 [Cercophora samala]
MPPKKKASTKKASFKGGHTASKSKSAKFKATATTSNKKTGPSKDKAPKDKTPKDKAPKDDAAAGFPQFSRFPVEIQQEIFTQALRKPSIHFMTVERAVERGSLNDAGVWVDYAWPTWHLTYHPKPKSSDTSGHRVNKTIGAVSHAARHAVVLATKNPGNLPFGRSWGPMDADNDLVALDFLPGATQHAKSDFRYFHVNNQFHPPYYDPDKSFPAGRSRVKKDGKSVVRSALTDEPSGMADLRRVGVVYKRVPGRVCGSRNTVFQCCVHDGDDDDDDDAGIGPHGDWTMCPEEVAGFIDSVPALEEFYFVVQVPHGDKEDQARLEMYKKWFFSSEFLFF